MMQIEPRRRKVPPFSLREDNMILAMRASGVSSIRIAAELEREFGVRRQPEAVNQRLKALAREHQGEHYGQVRLGN